MKSVDGDALLSHDSVRVTSGQYRGASAVILENNYLRLVFRPEAGGRMIQMTMGGYDFLWENNELSGLPVPAGGLDGDGGWLNWGGEKIWPSPQGWARGFYRNFCSFKGLTQNDWNAGPPMAGIDGRKWDCRVSDGSLIMKSSENNEFGISFTREIRTFDNSTRINVFVEMVNTDNIMHKWGIWTNSQLNPVDRDLVITVPINKSSIYPEGFSQQFGLVGTNQVSADYESMLLEVKYKNEVAKFGIDSDGGWIATTDRFSGKAYVKTFSWYPGGQYPDNSSVEIWLNGSGAFYGFDRKIVLPDNEKQFVEAELLGPLTELEPGGKTCFIYNIYTVTIQPGKHIASVAGGGVSVGETEILSKDGILSLSASLGVFYSGEISLRLFNRGGICVSEIDTDIEVSPELPVLLDGYRFEPGATGEISSIQICVKIKGGSSLLLEEIKVC